MANLLMENPLLKDRVAEHILGLVSKGCKPGTRIPSERTFASTLGVSRKTVQKALELLDSQGLLARRRGSGTYLAMDLSLADTRRESMNKKVGRVVVVSQQAIGEDFYWAEIFSGLANAARHKAISVERLSPEDVARFDEPGMAAVPKVILGVVDLALLAKFVTSEARRPVVVDAVVRDLPVTSIVDGSFEGVRQAVGRLIAAGHKRIGCLHPENWQVLNPAKMAGYHVALQEGGAHTGPEMLAACDETTEQVMAAASRLLAQPSPPTAFFCFNDARALRLLEYLREQGTAVGKGIAVIGFGDTAFRQGICRTLSSVRIPMREMGERALLEAIKREPPRDGKVVVIRDRVILRESTGHKGRQGRRRARTSCE